jgi:NAD(P)-dependent dehydrogenase (short-subunit alcohol dehydrogenase family)
MEIDLPGKIAIVTGSATGIGLAIARGLRERAGASF